MPTSTICSYHGNEITIEEALEIRGDQKLAPGTFECTECANPVRPHRGGGHASAHFEHCSRNPECPLSHFHNAATYTPPEYYDLEDPKAVEGYGLDGKVLARKRNSGLAKKCKERDNFTCLSCGFSLEVKGRHVVECHHTVMVSGGEREVSLSELITLCPTCHRISHTRREPYTLEELKRIRAKP